MKDQNSNGNGKPYVDPEAGELFEQLRVKYRTHQAAARAMNMNRRLYASWRFRGLGTEPKWQRAKTILRRALQSE